MRGSHVGFDDDENLSQAEAIEDGGLKLILALYILVAVGVGPAPVTVIPPPVVSAPLSRGERRIAVICRSEARSGTRVVRRICTPVEDVVRRERDAQEALREFQSKSPQP